MSNVNIMQINLPKNDITSLTGIIIRQLTKNKNTQIFISSVLYEELLKNSERYCIWIESVYSGFQYSDGVEKAFLLKKDLNSFDYIMQMNFVCCCKNFYQLTYFALKTFNYSHYLNGMNDILIINAD